MKARNNSQLVHNYAHQAFTGEQGSSLFYEGPTLYSYGHHFPICHIARSKTGEEVLFWHDKSYSNTTSKHQALAARATRHMVRIDIPANQMDRIIYSSEDSEFTALASVWRDESRRLIKILGTTGKAYAKRLNAYAELRALETNVLKFIRDYLSANFAKPPRNFGFFTVIREVLESHASSEQHAADTAAREKRSEAAQAAADTRASNQILRYRRKSQSTPEEIAEWIAGTRASVRPGEYDILRVCSQNLPSGYVETSQGVKMSINWAKAIYAALLNRDLKAGDKVLDQGYTVLKVNGTVQIGCHTFETEYLLNFGKTL